MMDNSFVSDDQELQRRESTPNKPKFLTLADDMDGQEGGEDDHYGVDQCVEIIKKLWELLDDSGDHQ